MFKRPSGACGQYDSMFTLMFLALHHSAHVDIYVLVVRAVFLDAAVSLIPKFLRPIQEGNELGLLLLFLCFVEQNEDFHRRNYCAVVLQSRGC